MSISLIAFDHFDVRGRLNPSLPPTPVHFDAWSHVGKTVWLDPRRVKPMEDQPRDTIDAIEEFAQTLKEHGQITTILVHPITHPDFDVELTAGERRTHGCRAAEIMIRAEIKPVPVNRKAQYVHAVIENFNRRDLTLYEAVRAVQKLVSFGYNQAQIGVMVGKNVGWVSNHITLASLDLQVLKMLDTPAVGQRNQDGRKLRRNSVLPMDIALQVVKLEPKNQFSFAQMLIEEGIPISVARSLVRRRLKDEGKKPARDLHPKECFTQLDREVRNIEAMVSRYCHDLEPTELRSIARQQERHVYEGVARRLNLLSRELRHLSQTINPVIDPALWHPRLQEWLIQQGISQDQFS